MRGKRASQRLRRGPVVKFHRALLGLREPKIGEVLIEFKGSAIDAIYDHLENDESDTMTLARELNTYDAFKELLRHLSARWNMKRGSILVLLSHSIYHPDQHKADKQTKQLCQMLRNYPYSKRTP